MEKEINTPSEKPKTVEIEIPRCCREGWDSCPHVVNRDEIKKKRTNIGL